jgi:hypothetical protein
MTDQVEERAYRWQRRYVFAVTLAVILVLPVLVGILA